MLAVIVYMYGERESNLRQVIQCKKQTDNLGTSLLIKGITVF